MTQTTHNVLVITADYKLGTSIIDALGRIRATQGLELNRFPVSHLSQLQLLLDAGTQFALVVLDADFSGNVQECLELQPGTPIFLIESQLFDEQALDKTIRQLNLS